jgi:phage-related baseplate assembly protein
MPNVGGKKFPYTKAGIAAAKRAAVGMRGGGEPAGVAQNKMIQKLIGETGKTISDADRERVSRMMGRNEGAADSKLIMRLLQELAEGEAVARGNRVSAMEALDSGAKMSDLDMDAINMALGRGVTKSIRPRARPQGMMYGGKVKKGKVKKYKGGGCVMAGRGGNFKGVK